MKHIAKYRPEYSTEYYIKECIRRIFDLNDLYDQYDIDRFIQEAIKVIPEERKGTSVLNRSLAAYCIYTTSKILGKYKNDKIPRLTQLQVARACSISAMTIRSTLRRYE